MTIMAVRSSQGSGRGNLTGSFRVLNDLVVTFHNTIQSWRSSVIDGVHALQKVQTSGEKNDAKEKRCEIVGTVIETLEKHVAELEQIQMKLENLAKLNADKPSGCRTWTYDNIVAAGTKIIQAHKEETALRRRYVVGMDTKTGEDLEEEAGRETISRLAPSIHILPGDILASVHYADGVQNTHGWIYLERSQYSNHFTTFKMLRSLALRSLKNAEILQSAKLNFVPQGSRAIHGWVRPFLIRMYKRKKEAAFKRIGPPKKSPRSSYTDWNYNSEIYSFAKRLGEEFDEKLLRTAFVDKSFVHQQQQQQAELSLEGHMEAITDNSNLASEGRALLVSLVEEILRREYPKLPSEGISAITSFVTSEDSLSNLANLIGSKDLILCEDYPPSPSTSANVFNAIIAALDKSSGRQRTRRFICDIVVTQVCGRDILDLWEITHPWSYLCNVLETQNKEKPEPRLIAQAGANTILAAYIVGLYDTNKALLGRGFGETVEIAHEMAARDVLRDIFGIRRPRSDYNFLTEPAGDDTVRIQARS